MVAQQSVLVPLNDDGDNSNSNSNNNGMSRGVNPQEATIPEDYSAEREEPDSPTATKNQENGHQNGSYGAPSSPNRRRKKKGKKKRKKKAAIMLTSGNGSSNGSNHKHTKIVENASPAQSITKKKRKKRNRTVCVASVGSIYNQIPGDNLLQQQQQPPTIPLPTNHYKTIVVRRAIRKRRDSNIPIISPSRDTATRGGETQTNSNGNEPIDDGLDGSDADDMGILEEYGDTSLGMKLSVVAGKVIIQMLNRLSDGRASPAQMVGVIQRGDVLVSINNFSLVHLPIDLLMDRLKPLSTPDATGAYQRILHLRLAAGEGLDLLRKYEAAEARKANISSEMVANEVFTLFPMVDQLSGMPLFDNQNLHIQSPSEPTATQNQKPSQQREDQYQEEKKQTEEDPSSLVKTEISGMNEKNSSHQQPRLQPQQQHPQLSTMQDQISMDEIIASHAASWRATDREKFTSEFYAWNDNYSELMRPVANIQITDASDENEKLMSKYERLELGRKALMGAATLSRAMENMDRGKDMRSFRSWNSSISLRSRASTRRRYILDAVSLPVTMRSAVIGGQKGGSLASDSSERSERSEMADVDGDALLLRLAAHDEIWRKQVVEALEEARDQLDNDSLVESDEEAENDPVQNNDGIDSAITNGLGTFLFGETMAKIVTKKKKSKALPPDEITVVLFDLSTNLASTMPDEVDVGGGSPNNGLLKSSFVPFTGRKNQEAGSSIILATRFVLEEALVIWLETFRPLPWESRRVLWPKIKMSPTGESRSPSMFSDGDSLTLDSGQLSPSSAYSTSTGGHREQSRDLQQQIEDQELDPEARAETCFLVTYYFTQRLLPKLARETPITTVVTDEDGGVTKAGELVEFVKKYGAYMKLHTCLAYAAALKRTDVIDALLELAEHDLRHREVIKLFARRNALILYEPTMLSAIVKCLPLIAKETTADRRQVLVDICVSAYPDLCPWQLKEVLLETQENATGSTTVNSLISDLRDLYYYYLSSLLHPHDGHDAARHDTGLVEEWCILSLDTSEGNITPQASARRKNFLSVASRNSSNHLSYHRDLVMLVELCMGSREYNLALELVGEIADNPALVQKNSVVTVLLQNLRVISHDALDHQRPDAQDEVSSTLKRVIRLFHHLSAAFLATNEHPVSVPDELHALLVYGESRSSIAGKGVGMAIIELVHLIAREALPNDFLLAFCMWTATHDELSDTVHVLQSVLRKGARRALNSELSGSLLRLRRAREHTNKSNEASNTAVDGRNEGHEATIWSLMSKGLVLVDK